MSVADARRWALAAKTDAAEARVLAQDLHHVADEQRARLIARELELRAQSLHRSSLFALKALSNDSTGGASA